MEPEAAAAAPAPPAARRRPVARPLLPVALALMVGIAAPAWGLSLPEKWLVPGLAGLWAALALLWWRGRPARLLPLAFFALLGVAFCQQALHPVFPPQHLVRLPEAGEVTLAGALSRPGKLVGERVQLVVAAQAVLTPEGWRPLSGRLLVTTPALAPPPVGSGVVLKGRLLTPRARQNPGTFDRPRYLATDGIFREMRLRDRDRLVFLAGAEAYPLGEKLRGGIRGLLRELSPPIRAIYLAMLLGDQGEITPEMRLAFARTGTSHLLVINGLHLGMVAAVTYFLAFWLLRRLPWLLLRFNVVKAATLISALPVVAYAWVAGGSASTQRAEIMVLAYLLLVFLGRPREVWSALALAAVVILSLAPLRLFTISFQLSFMAVAALIYLVPRWVRWASSEAADRADRTPAWWSRALFRGWEWLVVSAVATLATAPLVAAYFQVVSLLGILVNLVAIPLVLGLALPLGEAAVLFQALGLTPVAQFFLALGQAPLWLGYQVIALGAGLPGSAITMPVPTWGQIAAYYLLLGLLLAPRRSSLTWSGAALAAVFLTASVAWPLLRPQPYLEVTCLDSRGLAGVAVAPEGQRLVFSAPAPSWPGAPGGGPGVLPAYCHWRQFRHLDLVAALTLSQDNAGEMLALARQFEVGAFWFGRRGRPGPAYWDLTNYLGDRGQTPRSLERRPPESLGSVQLAYLPLAGGRGLALSLAWGRRRALILPPARHLAPEDLGAAAPLSPDLLVLPAAAAGEGQTSQGWLKLLKPGCLVLYGGAPHEAAGPEAASPRFFTRRGAVSVYLGEAAVRVKQWRAGARVGEAEANGVD